MGTLSMIVTMLLLMTLGIPVSIAVGVAALVGVLVTDAPLDVLPRMMIENVDSFALLAAAEPPHAHPTHKKKKKDGIPRRLSPPFLFFLVAGNLLNITGITER